MNAFSLINAIYIYCPQATLGQYVPTIVDLLMRKLSKAVEHDKVVPYVKHMIHSQCLFVTIFGAPAFFQTLEGLRGPGLVANMISNVWIANKKPLSSLSALDKKHVLVGVTKLMVETPLLESFPATWLHLLQILLSLVYEQHDLAMDFKVDEETAESREFDGHYSKLSYAAISILDPVAEITNVHSFAAAQVQQFSRSLTPERATIFQQALAQLSPAEREGVQKML